MSSERDHTCSAKIWIEYQGKPLIGPGTAMILQGIADEKSISKTAKKLGMSYCYVWDHLQTIEQTLGKPIVTTHKGGSTGGGGAILNELGLSLLAEYLRVRKQLDAALFSASPEAAEEKDEPILLKGKILSVEKGIAAWKLSIQMGQRSVITLKVKKEAMEGHGIGGGDEVEARIKAQKIQVEKSTRA